MSDKITLDDRNEYVRERFTEFVQASERPEIAETIYQTYLKFEDLYEGGMAGVKNRIDDPDKLARLQNKVRGLRAMINGLNQRIKDDETIKLNHLSATKTALEQAFHRAEQVEELLANVQDVQENGHFLVGLRANWSGVQAAGRLVDLRAALSKALRHCELDREEVPRDPIAEFAEQAQKAVKEGDKHLQVGGILRGGGG